MTNAGSRVYLGLGGGYSVPFSRYLLGYGFLIRAFHKLLGNFLAACRISGNVFRESVLNGAYNFVRVCPNYKQDKICLYSKYTKASTVL